MRAGSTAVVVVHDGAGLLTCANVGDSRAVLCRDGQAVDLSTDQKPDRPDETARIVDAGGYVTGSRTLGQLAVARALGDKDLKAEVEGALVAEPEIEQWTLRSSDEFVVVACDGLYDVMTSQQVVDFVRERIQRGVVSTYGSNGLADICEQLTREAVHARNSKDNVSVIVAVLTNEPPPKTTAAPKQSSSFSSSALASNSATSNTNNESAGTAIGSASSGSSSSSGGADATKAKKNDINAMDDEELMDFLMDDENFA